MVFAIDHTATPVDEPYQQRRESEDQQRTNAFKQTESGFHLHPSTVATLVTKNSGCRGCLCWLVARWITPASGFHDNCFATLPRYIDERNGQLSILLTIVEALTSFNVDNDLSGNARHEEDRVRNGNYLVLLRENGTAERNKLRDERKFDEENEERAAADLTDNDSPDCDLFTMPQRMNDSSVAIEQR